MSTRGPSQNKWADLITPVGPQKLTANPAKPARDIRPGASTPVAKAAPRPPEVGRQVEPSCEINRTGVLALVAPDGLLTDALARSLALLGHGIEVRRATGDPGDPSVASARLILIDHDLPDSEILLSGLRRRTAAPIVALVPSMDHAAVEACMAKGATACVSKTFSEARTLELLTAVLDARAPLPATAGSDALRRDRPNAEPERSALPYRLTPSELDVLRLLAQGLTNLQIALRRKCTEGTVKVHLDKVYRKLGVENRAQAILVANRTVAVRDLQIQHMEQESLRLEWLLPYTQTELRQPGEVLFHKGETGDALYYIQHGRVVLVELGVQLSDGCVLGEIGIFSPEHQRTSTAKCDAETRLFRLGAEQARRLYIENPQFAYHVLRLISGRLIADQQRHGQTVH